MDFNSSAKKPNTPILSKEDNALERIIMGARGIVCRDDEQLRSNVAAVQRELGHGSAQPSQMSL